MHVTLLLADHCSAASATMALEILRAANLFADAGEPLFEVVVASHDGLPVPSLSGQPLLIDELAGRFGFGVRNFKRRFKEATGYTPLAYLQTLRLEKAKQLLETTRMSLDSITFAVGYEDSNSFRRLFQQRVGLLPAAYRKKFQARAG